MTHEEIIRMMQGGKVQPQPNPDITVEKIDKFINKVVAEKDETLYSLAQALQWKLQAAPVVSFPELEVLPMVLRRLQERLNKGEK
jgi:hypothetical protein